MSQRHRTRLTLGPASVAVSARGRATLAVMGWFLLAFMASGLALACLTPLVARQQLLAAADAYRPMQMAVHELQVARKRQGGRIAALGTLPDGRAVRVVLPQGMPWGRPLPARHYTGATPPLADRDAAAPAAQTTVPLAVRVNPALAGTWLRRDEVLIDGVDWPARWRRDRLQLGLMIAVALPLSLWSGLRCRRAARAVSRTGAGT